MKKILITGITGFAGSFLAEHLAASDNEIHGTYQSETSLRNLDAVKEKVQVHQVDLVNTEKVLALITQVQPQELYHLAALTSPAASFQQPAETITNNISAQLNIFNGLKHNGLTQTRVLVTSSAEVYGKIDPENIPTDEATPLRPVTPYAVSKIAQDYLGLQYFLSDHISVIRIRPFNHTGPRQSPQFAVAAFAKQIAEIEKGKQEPVVKVGNLEAKRDVTDVRDMVKAYALAMEKATPGEVYNIGQDSSHTMQSILDTLLSLSSKEIRVEQDPQRVRPSEIPELLCNSSKFKAATGWKPEIPLEQTLKDTLEYWQSNV